MVGLVPRRAWRVQWRKLLCLFASGQCRRPPEPHRLLAAEQLGGRVHTGVAVGVGGLQQRHRRLRYSHCRY